ncbi:uncharacterized protein LOC131954537 [Physella acuta]|uniref:uncharacterized protein LOC131954537 n=1 Tax=Physella acuta TaxID=109671 RepID=UPI0027DADBAD|nr:uncharacterized protein LOC131954537 [Physella acuta]
MRSHLMKFVAVVCFSLLIVSTVRAVTTPQPRTTQAHSVVQPRIVKERESFVVNCEPESEAILFPKNHIVMLYIARKAAGDTQYVPMASLSPNGMEEHRLFLHTQTSSEWAMLPTFYDRMVLRLAKRHAEVKDSGDYTCNVIFNKDGKMHKQVQDSWLRVLESPQLPVVSHSIIVIDEFFSVSCDQGRVKFNQTVLKVLDLKLLHIPDCKRHGRLLGEYTLSDSRITLKDMSEVNAERAGFTMKLEHAEDSSPPGLPQLRLRVKFGEMKDAGCYRCEVGYMSSSADHRQIASSTGILSVVIPPDSVLAQVKFTRSAFDPEEEIGETTGMNLQAAYDDVGADASVAALSGLLGALSLIGAYILS